MGILARLLNTASLGLVDGNNLEYQARDGMGLVSEQEKAQRQLQEAAQQTQLRQMEDANRQAQSMQNATKFSPLFEALNSPDQITNETAYRQFTEIGAKNPEIRDAYNEWRQKDTELSIADAGLSAKVMSVEGAQQEMKSKERKDADARMNQGSIAAIRTGGKRGAALLGLPPDSSPETVLAVAQEYRQGLSPSLTDRQSYELGAAGFDPLTADSDKIKTSAEIAQQKRIDEARAKSFKIENNINGKRTGIDSEDASADPISGIISRADPDTRNRMFVERGKIASTDRKLANMQESGKELVQFIRKNKVGIVRAFTSRVPGLDSELKQQFDGNIARVKELVGDAVSGADFQNVVGLLPEWSDVGTPGLIQKKIENAMDRVREINLADAGAFESIPYEVRAKQYPNVYPPSKPDPKNPGSKNKGGSGPTDGHRAKARAIFGGARK